jgi:cell division protein FtsL
MVLVGALCASVGVVHVTSRVMVVSTGYRKATLEQTGQTLERENERLRLELATLKNPGRLEHLAREQLGMIPPPAGAVLAVQGPSTSSGRTGVPLSPSGVEGAPPGVAVARRTRP